MTVITTHYRTGRRNMSQATTLRNTVCSRGHTHPPWNTTGVLRIAKCESVCGFCQKETKTAANLRKHVAIHIKNELLNLTIAEGSSGRGRLEIPLSRSLSTSSVSSTALQHELPDTDQSHSHSGPSSSSSHYSSISQVPLLNRDARRLPALPSSISEFSPSATLLAMQRARSSYTTPQPPPPIQPPLLNPGFNPTPGEDHFRHLRNHNLTTKEAWTAIPASEGFKILDLCRSLSATSSSPLATWAELTPTQQSHFPSHASSSQSHPHPHSSSQMERIPCYNRETIFDEEWQQHMKDVHGVYLLWPETWMRRIEILDLDGFGGDIVSVNDFVMQG